MTNLLTRNSKLDLNNPFVRMSATCCEEGTKGMQIRPVSTFSFMKCLSISTCLVRSCWTGFWEILIAALLSQYNFIGRVIGSCNSSRILLSHKICLRIRLCLDGYGIDKLTSPLISYIRLCLQGLLCLHSEVSGWGLLEYLLAYNPSSQSLWVGPKYTSVETP